MNCHLCRHYDPRPPTDSGEEGACRRFPPSVLMTPEGSVITLFPVVPAHWRCGEWQPAS